MEQNDSSCLSQLLAQEMYSAGILVDGCPPEIPERIGD